jgi:hypothetical protein
MERITRSLVTAGLLVSAVCPSLLGHTKHAPLPEQVLQAKTVYIDNQSGLAALGDRAYDELSKWGRFKIVSSAKDSDLVLLLSARAYVTGYNTYTRGTAQGSEDSSGNIQLSGNSQSQTHAQVARITYMTAIDPKTGNALWSDQKAWGNLYTGFHSATRGLVKELRDQRAGGRQTQIAVSLPCGNLPSPLPPRTPNC